MPIDKKEYFRRLWFHHSNTIGLRKTQSRWILLRRGECSTDFGKIKAKQTLKPDGTINIKPENDEIFRLKSTQNKTTAEIIKIVEDSNNFTAFESWT